MRRGRLVALASSLVVVAAASVTTAAVLNRDDGTFASPTTTTSASTTVPTTTTTLPALPQPAGAPLDPYENVPVTQIGTIEIPKVGLSHAIYEGVWLTVVDHGPGHWPGSAMPGKLGNATFAGHRVTHSRPFYDLDQLVVGDQVIFHMADGDFVYEITESLIVEPDALWIVNQTAEHTMTLFACHPKHSAAQRIVVKGKLVSPSPAA